MYVRANRSVGHSSTSTVVEDLQEEEEEEDMYDLDTHTRYYFVEFFLERANRQGENSLWRERE